MPKAKPAPKDKAPRPEWWLDPSDTTHPDHPAYVADDGDEAEEPHDQPRGD